MEGKSESLQYKTYLATETILERVSQFLTDERLPPPDVPNELEERGILQDDLVRIRGYIRTNWPHVRQVSCGRRFGSWYFAIEIDSADEESRQKHMALPDWFRARFPALRDLNFFVHGELGETDLGAAFIVYSSQPESLTQIQLRSA